MHNTTALRTTVRVITIALAAQISLSWPLWHTAGGRTFPELPLPGFQFYPAPALEGIQTGLLLLALLATALFPQKTWFRGGLACLVLWLVARDLNRLQPWTYFYLAAFGLLFAAGNDARTGKRYLQWLVAAVYAWGGFNKITPYFAIDNFPWFCEAFKWTKYFGAFPAAGYAVAAGEMLLGPGLLLEKTRPVFRWLTVLFHLFIALALSPLGLDWNTVVIPWNFAMAGMVWVLFRTNPESGMYTWRQNSLVRTALATTLLALAWVLPALNIFHHWDEALSWKMYSNTQTEASFYSKNGAPCAQVVEAWRQFSYDHGTKMLFDDWAMADIHVPAYNSRRAHLQLARYLCACQESPGQPAGLLLVEVDRWNRSAEREVAIPCTGWPR